ncbi:predicted protein [Nematostella vectensis]|uniref:60S ribosomal protein L29 n=1 Tax=Nematostella vectensis TaxID=45351 RepID=A7RTA1_NEMVE|nr:predicted protein [Nematostella vectensis]|eukprot:XP_001637494.1 predicted protein [Nematostella vectensis]
MGFDARWAPLRSVRQYKETSKEFQKARELYGDYNFWEFACGKMNDCCGHKWHRNGIKKPRTNRYPSLKGVDPKFLRNLRFSKKHNKKHPNVAAK